ncbi:hypothetical protein BKA69DRAFT_1174949 [Paraphysoderma sedebokerense]|nr:hypothetical protein BKA69DRAFT_1174949 [Paraphysoderma sedebokerense]
MKLSPQSLLPALCLATLSLALPTASALPMDEETIPNRTIDCWNEDWITYNNDGIEFIVLTKFSDVGFTSLEYRKVTEGTALVAFMFSHMKKCTPNIKTISTSDPGLLLKVIPEDIQTTLDVNKEYFVEYKFKENFVEQAQEIFKNHFN